MLHGSPARNVFGGIKIAACGELGIGVGEEERGSAERQVLEAMVERTDGLVDLVVCKYGSYDPDSAPGGDPAREKESWLGLGDEPGGEDGAVFLGVGTLSKNSVRDITCWMDDLYAWGKKPMASRKIHNQIAYEDGGRNRQLQLALLSRRNHILSHQRRLQS